MTFTLYGFVRLHFEAPARYIGYFDNEYRRIANLRRRESSPPLDITVHVVPHLPSAQAGDIRQARTFKRLFRFEYLVRGLSTSHVHLYFRDHAVSRLYPTAAGVFLQAQLLEPIMYLKLLEQDVLFMHCAGVADDEAGYVFPAFGGTGKTTLCLALLAEGFRLLGDDLLLLDARSGQVFAYPRPLHLFRYNISSLRDATVPVSLRAKIHAKDVLRFVLERATGQEFLISTRVHLDELYRSVPLSRPVPFKRIVFLKKEGDRERVPMHEDAGRRRVAEAVIESADLNTSLYENVLLDPERRRQAEESERAVTMRVLSQVPFVEFVNTRKLNLDALSGFARGLKGEAEDDLGQGVVR